MVVTKTIYVNTTVIMTMTATTTMIMTMTAIKTMIRTMIATTTMTKNMTTTMTKNITTNMTTIFKQVQKGYFYCLLKMIKKIMKIKFVLKNLLKKYFHFVNSFFITQPTKFIDSTLYH